MFRRLLPWSHMNEPYLSPYRRTPLGGAWVQVIAASTSLCFSLWVTVFYPRPGGFFVRYGLLSLGIAILVGAIINLLSRQNRARGLLWALWWVAFVGSLVGLIKAYR